MFFCYLVDIINFQMCFYYLDVFINSRPPPPLFIERTKNFSGAEIEGLGKSAVSFALHRQVDVEDLSKSVDEENMRVTMQDFDAALEEVIPAFGSDKASLETYRLNGIIPYSDAFTHLYNTARMLVQQCHSSEKTPMVSLLLDGPMGSGTTALAATIAIDSGFPFVKIITSDNMVGYTEAAKCSKIAKVFDDAYKSTQSIIVLDDLERLLEYVPIGPRFSNAVLQTLLVLVKRMPPPGRKLFVVGTTCNGHVLSIMDLSSAFQVMLT
jgi:vesicle-fusing ATPase